jgi:hypothetical protein
MSNAVTCPVAELDRQAIAAMDAATTPEAGRQASERAFALREAQTFAIAASGRGLALQLVELEIAHDEGDDHKFARLHAVDGQAIEGLVPEPAALAA